jgi:uncharacterized protein
MDPATLDALRINLHPFGTPDGAHVFVADGSRIYRIPALDAEAIARAIEGRAGADDLTRAADMSASLMPPGPPPHIGPAPAAPPPIQSLSLNVAQACNMSCGYCYASEGTFGGDARLMRLETAKAAVDRLLIESAPGSDVVVGFMGGEPLLNRSVVHEVTRYAWTAASTHGRTARFSITTNGTLLTAEDADLFARFPFTVTVSVDGPPDVHRRLRMLNDGGDAYARLVSRLGVFAHRRPRYLSARVTVTPVTGDLVALLNHVIGMGFDDVGFAPVLVSPTPTLAFAAADFTRFLQQMILCGSRSLNEALAGRRYPFGNFETAMHEIHRGAHRPYPCGAGAAYLSVNAEGELFACHRLIDDPSFAMGDVQQGPRHERRVAHLRDSHVDRMEPCRSCWARYLCGGGCYHEVSRRGRIACDYIRGWLHFCLEAYVQLSAARPEYFDDRVSALAPSRGAATPGSLTES